MVIKTWINEAFQEILFEHTRNLWRDELDTNKKSSSKEPQVTTKYKIDSPRSEVKGRAWPARHWPGCDTADPASELKRRTEGYNFWFPEPTILEFFAAIEEQNQVSDTDLLRPPSTSENPSGNKFQSPGVEKVLPYLSWPLAPHLPTLSRLPGQQTAGRIPESKKDYYKKAQQPTAHAKILADHLHEQLLLSGVSWEEVPTRAKEELNDLLAKVSFERIESRTYVPSGSEHEVCRSFCELLDHYLPEGLECILKSKVHGALYAMIQVRNLLSLACDSSVLT